MLVLPVLPKDDVVRLSGVLSDFLQQLLLHQDLQVSAVPTTPGTYNGQRAWLVPPVSGQPMGWVWDLTTWKAMANYT